MVSPQRRAEIIDALRRGTVPKNGLDVLAVGFNRFVPTLDQELDTVAVGRGTFKAVRGEYGSGKTFLSERVENNPLAANQEIEKLALSAPGARIGLPELQGAIADNSRYDAFDLVAAAFAGRLDQAFKVLRGLRAKAAEPVMILWAILRELRLVCRLSWRSGRGEALEALFAEHHIWQARQGPLRDALKRHTTTGLWTLLLLAGRAERGRAWASGTICGWSSTRSACVSPVEAYWVRKLGLV